MAKSTQHVWVHSCLLICLLSFRAQSQEAQLDRRVHNLETELAKLRLLHQQRKDRIQFLEKELNHYFTGTSEFQIIQGVELLCSTLAQYRKRQPTETTTAPDTTKTQPPKVNPVPTVAGITATRVATVISSIRNAEVVQITVFYITTESHNVIWAYNVLGHMVPVKDGDPFSSSRNEKNGETFRTTLTIDRRDLERMELLYVKILSEFSEVTILFNETALLAGESLNLMPLKIGNEGPVTEVIVSKPNQNVNLSLNLDTNINSLSGYVNFIGINTTRRPNHLLDLQSNDPRVQSALVNTTQGYRWTVSLDKTLVDVGGMMSLRAVETMRTGPILQMHVGKTLYIIPDKPNTPKSPFPRDSLALLSLYRYTGRTISAKPPIAAIWCYAFGNPVPKTSIYKLSMTGQKTKLPGHVFNIGKYDEARVSIVNNITTEDEGTYMCEAISGSHVVAEIVNLYIRS